jgi:dihydrofolate synthase/folylpolyglutamate synthase
VESARTQNGDDVSLTYFEFTTLAILRLMSHSPLDVAILEVGLGGRLDATNIIDADCAIITSIDIDHTEYLGDGPRKHRREKAGIMRTGKPGGRQRPDAAAKRDRPCARNGGRPVALWARLQLFGRQAAVGWAGRGRRYAGLAYPALRGANQLVNASGVLAALRRCASACP